MKNLTKFKVNSLYQDVVNEIVEDSQDYGEDTPEENILTRLKDIAHGLSSGIVGRLIYYQDTARFYDDFKIEINQLVYELLDETGLSIGELFSDWDKSDPLVLNYQNKNLLSWFAYEEISYRLRNYLEG